jgi:hypothetical protein
VSDTHKTAPRHNPFACRLTIRRIRGDRVGVLRILRPHSTYHLILWIPVSILESLSFTVHHSFFPFFATTTTHLSFLPPLSKNMAGRGSLKMRKIAVLGSRSVGECFSHHPVRHMLSGANQANRRWSSSLSTIISSNPTTPP